MDVNNTFLYGDLNHTIYMAQPSGYEVKAQLGTTADASLFVKRSGDNIAIVLIYVDDLIVTGNWVYETKQLQLNISTRLKIKDLGCLNHFLGLEVSYNSSGLVLHQSKYTRELLQRFGMYDAKTAVTPIDVNIKLYKKSGTKLEDPTEYRQIIGSLSYLTLTRPDIAFSVGVLSRFMQEPRKSHLFASRRALRYIKYTIGFELDFKRESRIKLKGFCDTDYARDLDERRSRSAYVFFIGDSVVSWCSKHQPIVSLSTTEAEYRASTLAAQELAWLVRLLQELNQKWTIKSMLSGEIDLVHVDTSLQVADMLTKGLPKAKRVEFCVMMGMKEIGIERECGNTNTTDFGYGKISKDIKGGSADLRGAVWRRS
ncbi:uncharacterized mitochondrial protein AtMg00810-like [Helianthus annuus]|uniref:uncharacterized mitochondrial protein AtMg00810-like n=1 Tax=Helianthus annuus TaxID=4232 RepID=UPI0016533167|nr:uncharacterized mitochondrial protein AtMg00810-like [Helianthus annuus]